MCHITSNSETAYARHWPGAMPKLSPVSIQVRWPGGDAGPGARRKEGNLQSWEAVEPPAWVAFGDTLLSSQLGVAT